jgi:tol-pal system protein YbgF
VKKKTLMKKIFLIFVCCHFVLIAGCVTGQDRLATIEHQVISTRGQLSDMESEMKSGRESGLENDQNIRDRMAGMRIELDQMRSEIQNLTGRLDEIEFMIAQESSVGDKKRERTDDNVRLNNNRIVRLEEYLNLEPLELSKRDEHQGAEPVETVAELSEEQLYFEAKKAFDQGDPETAREGFEKLIKRYPKSLNADNAQFWIGEIYYREKWYEKAILEYQKVIEGYPKGNKVQAALLKQGLSFLNLGDTANARLILKELAEKYPKSSEADIARTKLKEL